KIMKKRVFTVTVIICSFLAMLIIDIFSLDISTITLLLIAALSGLIFTRFSDNFGNSKKSGQK
ncbi:MAG: hypothetical protein K6G27_05915, partial [Lachnospiraceae bacterium]|nr:hypothetical protein [Lachnospiraceae bacterium]